MGPVTPIAGIEILIRHVFVAVNLELQARRGLYPNLIRVWAGRVGVRELRFACYSGMRAIFSVVSGRGDVFHPAFTLGDIVGNSMAKRIICRACVHAAIERDTCDLAEITARHVVVASDLKLETIRSGVSPISA